MSTRWRCAVCEAVNDGGDTCTACGATVTETVVQAPPAEATQVPEGMAAPEERLGDQAATEIPVRELPRRRLDHSSSTRPLGQPATFRPLEGAQEGLGVVVS